MVTCTVGGTTSGYCATGKREQRDAADHHDQDREDVGEDRPLDEKFGDHGAPPPISLPRASCAPASTFCPGLRADAVDHHAVVRGQARFDHPQIADLLAGFDLALLDDIVLVDDQHVTAGSDRCRARCRARAAPARFWRNAHADEIAGQQRAIGIVNVPRAVSVPVDGSTFGAT